ncbi:hypothetical protein Angca_003354, partial [Angiostrongylus cantonensis]
VFSVPPLDVKIVDLLLNVFAPKTMGKCLIFALGFMLANYLWGFLVEVYSRPTILKPKGPLPFFSNSSSSYVTDYYTGNFLPEKTLRHYDLLVVMYYAPWSFHSRNLKHSFEVVALILRNHKNIRFVAVNCWTTTGECRRAYKIYQYPLIVAYSSTVHSIYKGEHSTDHLYSWIAGSVFPDKSGTNLPTPRDEGFAALLLVWDVKQSLRSLCCFGPVLMTFGVGFVHQPLIAMLHDVLHDSARFAPFCDCIIFCVICLTFRGVLRLPCTGICDSCQGSFPRFPNNTEVCYMTFCKPDDYPSTCETSVVILEREYWNCENNDLLSVVPTEDERVVPRAFSQEASSDKSSCAEFLDDVAKMDSCCRSLLASVDWDIACASSSKYHWEDEEMNTLVEERHKESRRTRNHWTKQVLAATKQCVAVRNASLNASTF